MGKVGAEGAQDPYMQVHLLIKLCHVTITFNQCRDLNAARECVGKVGAEGSQDPYMQLRCPLLIQNK